MALLADSVARGHAVEWEWEGKPYKSRLLVCFHNFLLEQCKSFDEDILPLMDERTKKL